MIIDNLIPVLILIVLGCLLKKNSLISDTFLNVADRLIYYIFFPAMLFWKIGGTPIDSGIQWAYCQAAVCALVTVYVCSTLYIKLFRVGRYQAGTFSQSCYRFNTYIGMAVVMNALGDAGVRHFGILIGVMIPLINILSVSTLIWFSGKQVRTKERVQITLRALIINPLILACVAGMFYARVSNGFPVFLDNTFRLAASVTLPLALLSIGGTLKLQVLSGYFTLSLVAAGFKLVLYPLTGYYFLSWFGVIGLPFQVAMLFFAMPTATSIFILSSQLNSDTDLASATIVLSTILSFFSLSFVMLLIR